VSELVLLECRAVGRKTPLDGRLELSAEAAARLSGLGESFVVLLGGRAGDARVETMECTCGKTASPGGSHTHHFVASPILRELKAGEAVRVELDRERGALLVRPG
jgi:hypothetical protein